MQLIQFTLIKATIDYVISCQCSKSTKAKAQALTPNDVNLAKGVMTKTKETISYYSLALISVHKSILKGFSMLYFIAYSLRMRSVRINTDL